MDGHGALSCDHRFIVLSKFTIHRGLRSQAFFKGGLPDCQRLAGCIVIESNIAVSIKPVAAEGPVAVGPQESGRAHDLTMSEVAVFCRGIRIVSLGEEEGRGKIIVPGPVRRIFRFEFFSELFHGDLLVSGLPLLIAQQFINQVAAIVQEMVGQIHRHTIERSIQPAETVNRGRNAAFRVSPVNIDFRVVQIRLQRFHMHPVFSEPAGSREEEVHIRGLRRHQGFFLQHDIVTAEQFLFHIEAGFLSLVFIPVLQNDVHCIRFRAGPVDHTDGIHIVRGKG